MIRNIALALLSALWIVPTIAFAATTPSGVVTQLTTQLSIGNRGDQVKVVQALLASDPTVFPEANITGYFGTQTQRAVSRFQLKQGLEQVGRVGPKTLGRLNALLQQLPLVFESTSTTQNTSGTLPLTSSAPVAVYLCLPSALGDAIQRFVKTDGTTMLPPCVTTDWGQFGTSTWSNSSTAWTGTSAPQHGQTSGTPSTSSGTASNTGDFLVLCKNPWATTPENIQWPKGMPCPKPAAAVTAPTPTPTPTPSTPQNTNPTVTGQNSSTNSSNSSSNESKQCPVPWESDSTITMSWPANTACPKKVVSVTPSPTPAVTPSTGNTSTASTKKCLSMLSKDSAVSDFTRALTQCGGAALQPTATNMQDKKICTLSINGTAWKFPFNSNRDCPSATVGSPVPAGTTATAGKCVLTLNGTTVSVSSWPTNIPCTGHL